MRYMNADRLSFVDSNVLLYRYDKVDAGKQRSARLWLDMLWESGDGRLSWQVLNEFYANATGKLLFPYGKYGRQCSSGRCCRSAHVISL